jgi:hypothetical protein
MKRILFLLILFSSACMAQDYYYQPKPAPYTRPHSAYKDSLHQRMFFLSINAGLSVPLRDYGSKDTAHNFMIIGPDSTNGKGFANIGFHGCIKGGIFLGPNYGLVGKLGLNYNTFDASTLNTIINGYYYYTINGGFSIWQFMGGAFANFKLEDNQSIWLEGMIGAVDANFPSFTVTIYNLAFNFDLQNATDFAWSLDMGYEKEITDNVSFVANITYTASELIYPTQTYNKYYYGSYTQHTPVTMSFGSLDFSIGLLFHL